MVALSLIGCGTAAPPPAMPPPEDLSLCSQVHREISRWQGRETDECGPDVSGMLELTPVGSDHFLVRRRFASRDEVWWLPAADRVESPPLPVVQALGSFSAAFTLLPGSPARLLVYDPRLSDWQLFTPSSSNLSGNGLFASSEHDAWPAGHWKSGSGKPWGHEMIGLEDGHFLDRDLGDGSTQIWTFVQLSNQPIQLQPADTLVGGPRELFRRGHRLVPLGRQHLLEWLPRPCPEGTDAPGPCAGSDYNVLSYSLDAGSAFEPVVVSSGTWSDIGADTDIVGDGAHLIVWTRASGRLRSFAIDTTLPSLPAMNDPLAGRLIGEYTANSMLSSDNWRPQTEAPQIKHLVLILQDGRSFDSYFGRYCRGPVRDDGQPLDCIDGPDCCEAMPAAAAGSCVDPEVDFAHVPVDTSECLMAKMNGGQMNAFAIASVGPAMACGDPRDVACAGTGAAAGAVATFHALAQQGALGDRFFQSYAYADGLPGTAVPSESLQNLLYLVTARFTRDPPTLFDRRVLTKELVRLDVPWAIYAGPVNLPLFMLYGVPLFYDPAWSPYRSLAGSEIEHDIAVGQLPSVAVVLPDRGDPSNSDAAGNPPDAGIQFTQRLIDAIEGSPYQRDTLVLVAYLTAGGFYDHVSPPPPQPLAVDGSSATAADNSAVHYGPRAPLLAVGRFARQGRISHVPLEMSSITAFIEWNWLHGSALKGMHDPDDVRRYRDTVVNNLGSLIDPNPAGAMVPDGHP
jgi:hypothetical protein